MTDHDDAMMAGECLNEIFRFLKSVGCECPPSTHDATPPMMYPEWIACAMRAYAARENAHLAACHALLQAILASEAGGKRLPTGQYVADAAGELLARQGQTG